MRKVKALNFGDVFSTRKVWVRWNELIKARVWGSYTPIYFYLTDEMKKDPLFISLEITEEDYKRVKDLEY